VIDQQQFDELVARHAVPGAVLAVSVGVSVQQFASGVLNVSTGVATTANSLFHLGSITKVYTATALLRLVEQGVVTLDSRVVDALPGFEAADARTTQGLTMRHLLTHTSGMAGDFSYDTGRGDDALARYVAACARVPPDHRLGATFSYCNAGYSILARVMEVLTAKTWERLVRDLVLDPIGADHSRLLAEEVLRFQAAVGHLPDGRGGLTPPPFWEPTPRGQSAAGGLCASAADVVAFARMHLTDPKLAVMREPQVAVPGSVPEHWGLGWMLWRWDSRALAGHQGGTLGQSAYLTVIPDADVVLVLLTNSGRSAGLYRDLFARLLKDTCGITMPGPWAPPAEPAATTGLAGLAGRYQCSSWTFDVTYDGSLKVRVTPLGDAARFREPFSLDLVAASDTEFFGRSPGDASWRRIVIENGRLHHGLRAAAQARTD